VVDALFPAPMVGRKFVQRDTPIKAVSVVGVVPVAGVEKRTRPGSDCEMLSEKGCTIKPRALSRLATEAVAGGGGQP
jgi:hypothetical protein